LLGACQDYLRHCKGAEVVDGAEADDAVIYLGYKYLEQRYDPIISSIDKDAMAYSGLRVWNFADLESSPVLIPQLGYLEKTAQGVKGAGFLWYCHQMLLGDATDHYRPFEACGQKLGEISCYNLLKDCKDEKQALQTVVAKYKEFIGDEFSYTDWQGVKRKVSYIDWLCLYHQCVRMKETLDDPLDFKQFSIKHGVPL
jgi:hypothetical protein